MHIHVKDEVSMPTNMDRRTYTRKLPTCLPFKNYKSESRKYLMCIYGRYMCTCIPNIKFLCLTLCQGEVCTDDTNADANDDDNSGLYKALWLTNQMSQKDQ